MTQECGQNVVDAGLVSIHANRFTLNAPYGYNAKDLKYLFEYESSLGYYDNDMPPSWIIFDFKERKISVNKYTIHFGQVFQDTKERWILHGSNDNETWTLIDDREKETKIHSEFEIEQYTSQNDPTTQFRFIRIMIRSGFCWGGASQFALTSIEFFGKLYFIPPEELPHSISFQGSDGKYVNDSVGSLWLEGGIFTSFLKRGFYKFSVFSYSGFTFIEGIKKLLTRKKCEVIAPKTDGTNTTVKIENDVLISAPSSSSEDPFIHSSLFKARTTKNFYLTYKNVLHLGDMKEGRVFISYTPFLSDLDPDKPSTKNKVPLAAIAALAMTI